jgi:hypothetical protein
MMPAVATLTPVGFCDGGIEGPVLPGGGKLANAAAHALFIDVNAKNLVDNLPHRRPIAFPRSRKLCCPRSINVPM